MANNIKQANRDYLEPLLEGRQKVTVSVSHIYKLKPSELSKMFKRPDDASVSSNSTQYQVKNQEIQAQNMRELAGHQYTTGVLKKLASDASTGIVGDEKDLRRRKNAFGRNDMPLPVIPTWFQSLKQTLMNPMWWVVAASAIISGICGGITKASFSGLVEGISILVAALFIILVTTTVDWFKDKRFVKLQSLNKEESVAVIRGKFGATQSVSIWDLVIGDVILLETGMRVPADCLIVSSADLQLDERHLLPRDEDGSVPAGINHDNFNFVHKSAADAEADGDADPFLYADSLIMRGGCKAVVCRVGENSSRGKMQKELDTKTDTPLQQKLKHIGDQFIVKGLWASGSVLVLMMVVLLIKVAMKGSDDDDETQADKSGTTQMFGVTQLDGETQTTTTAEKEKTGAVGTLFQDLPKHLNLVVVLIVVSIPEGLDLTIQLSLAFSVMKMHKDKILVRKLNAPERMGQAQEILCGKTGTLTKGDMRVKQFFSEFSFIKNTRKNTLLHCELKDETVQLIKESILYNCEARVEMDATTYVPVGNGTEVALLKFLQDADVPVHHLIQRKLGNEKAVRPFSSTTKYSAIAIELPDKNDTVGIYMKGAPEIVLDQCARARNRAGEVAEMTVEEREEIDNQATVMAGTPLRVMAFAYHEMGLSDWQNYVESIDTTNPAMALKEFCESFPDAGDRRFTFIGAFGLKDPLRPKVAESVKYAREDGELDVRLISGDHEKTAEMVAQKAGILKTADREGGVDEGEVALKAKWAVIKGSQFEEEVGAVREYKDKDGNKRTACGDMKAFAQAQKYMKVMYRATATHKHMFVVGLKDLNRHVVVTGDGINDVEALSKADCGLAMASGCSAAKDAADLILTDDDFDATLHAVMWGRNIYNNVSRFIQFQLTVNISAILTVFVGVCYFTESPLSAVQLLWINLIMDTFAAFALATEPPIPSVIKGPPFEKGQAILQPVIWRQVLGIAVWNFIVMLFAIFAIPYLIADWEDYDFRCVTADYDTAKGVDFNVVKNNSPANKRKHMTYIFNIFVFLQLFNEINCRKIGRRDFWVFERVLKWGHNWYFLIVFAGTFAAQVIMCEWGVLATITNTMKMTRTEWGACIIIGMSPLLISAIWKLTPAHWLKKYFAIQVVHEDREETSKCVKWYRKANENPLKKQQANQEETNEEEGEQLDKIGDDFQQQ